MVVTIMLMVVVLMLTVVMLIGHDVGNGGGTEMIMEMVMLTIM